MERELHRLFRDRGPKPSDMRTTNSRCTKMPRFRRKSSPCSLFPVPQESDETRPLTIERQDSVELDRNASLNSSSESVDDDNRRTLYSTCPSSGRRMVQLQFDVQGFSRRDIKVKLCGRKLIISALHRQAGSGRRSTAEFCRKIKLPDDVDVPRLECSYSDGVVTAQGPVLIRNDGSEVRA